MASLMKPWQVRYEKDGKRVPRGTPGAKKVKERARKWYGQDIPGLPRRKRVPLLSDKAVARRMLAELVRKGELGEVGLDDAPARPGTRPWPSTWRTSSPRCGPGARRRSTSSSR